MKNKRKNKFEENPKRIRRKRIPKFIKILMIIAVIMFSFVTYSTIKNGWGISGIIATFMGHNQSTKKEMGELKVLLLGVSTDISSKLTDTIIIASYNPETQKASLLSIPRDTYVGNDKTKASSYDKINSIYKKGPETVLSEVNEITGLDIKNYAVIETEALVELVDAIGGVTYDVPINMDYDDPTQDLHIHLKAGEQKLTGQQAEWLVRFRHNNNGTTYSSEYGNNDLGRMKTQRNFIMTTLKQTIQLKNVFKIKEIIDVVYKNIETNLDVNMVKDYIPYAIEFDTSAIQTETLPGQAKKINGLWFFEVDKAKTETLVNNLYNAEVALNDVEDNKIGIELLNGSASTKKLTEVTEILESNGYKVYKTGTTETTKKTSIINKTNQTDTTAKDIKNILGVGTISEGTTNAENIDFTIIIGKDYIIQK